MNNTEPPLISGVHAQTLLEELPAWGKLTTIILHAGSVFEFKGEFPTGSLGEGFYNLRDEGKGFTGHIGVSKVSHITFQEGDHRGRMSYALVFRRDNEEIMFKVFLGREASGEVFAHQLTRYQQLKNRWPLNTTEKEQS